MFKYQLTPGQLKIVGSILDPQVKRLSVCAMTRYGKTRAAALAVLLYVLNNENKRIKFIAPQIEQTNIIRNYCAEVIAETPALRAIVDEPGCEAPDRLRREVSKRRVTFTTKCELQTLTAYSQGEEPGKQLMGFGGDLIILEEACLISDEVYRSRISRMLGDSPDSKLVELINPWHKMNFAWRHWNNPSFKKIHIDYKQALAEGRISEVFLEEQRQELTPTEFQVLYEARFPDEHEDALIRWEWLQQAQQLDVNLTASQTVWGLDVAELGEDHTILTRTLQQDGVVVVTDVHKLSRLDTMATVNHVNSIVPKGETLNVDSIGIGAGVQSRLFELGHNAQSVRVSRSPTRQPDRFVNLKAERYWLLRSKLELGQLQLPRTHPQLITQLASLRYEFNSQGKIRVVDPPKSPDYADSLMLCMQEPQLTPWIVY